MTRTPRHLLALPLLLLLLFATGCTGSSDKSADQAQPAAESLADADMSADNAGGEAATGSRQASSATLPDQVPDKVISTGTVSLTADDVAALRFDVQRIADEQGGQVSGEETESGDDGDVTRSRMVLRVPTAKFTATMQALEKAGALQSSSQGSEVVTEQYVDLQARVRAQEKSLERVEVLFSRANSIRDIMAIEGQLTRRQADLDSLKGQLRYLEEQTAQATITVHLERTDVRDPEVDEAGFVAGLKAGWSAFTTSLTGLATVVGAVLPFALALGLLGFVVWLWVRRSLRSRRTATAAK